MGEEELNTTVWSWLENRIKREGEVPISYIRADMSLKNDCGMDSLDITELMFESENEFNINLTAKEIATVVTVIDAYNLINGKIKEKQK